MKPGFRNWVSYVINDFAKTIRLQVCRKDKNI